MNEFIVKIKSLPLWIGWIINAMAWIVFIGTSSHSLEITMGLLCLFSFYIGYHNKHNNLMYVSFFDAAWMFAWGFGFFGSSIGVLELFNLIEKLQ